jgi:hypothetical protein
MTTCDYHSWKEVSQSLLLDLDNAKSSLAGLKGDAKPPKKVVDLLNSYTYTFNVKEEELPLPPSVKVVKLPLMASQRNVYDNILKGSYKVGLFSTQHF